MSGCFAIGFKIYTFGLNNKGAVTHLCVNTEDVFTKHAEKERLYSAKE